MHLFGSQPPGPGAHGGTPWTTKAILLAPLPALLCLLFLLFLLPQIARGADPTLEAKVKAAYIYNFTKFIDWTPQEGRPASAPLRICIVGSDPIDTFLKEVAAREVKGRPLAVDDAGTDLTACEVLYVSRSEQERVDVILQPLQGRGVLTVSDIPDFVQHQGVIGFVTEGGKVRIEINLAAATKAGLKISAKLLEVARVFP